ncbi:hypothetical protein NLJ89_g643 [Agrocybe chaxingu]|uniref:Ferrochelatase, mitochondrial n=1 Tax=Agrocybe chaxingu TaxID=84603 RepID=A0A9W8N1I1_9AGAR|nr:hypothetical protein NLJ89_g643 [Agrocybe chaxingu]
MKASTTGERTLASSTSLKGKNGDSADVEKVSPVESRASSPPPSVGASAQLQTPAKPPFSAQFLDEDEDISRARRKYITILLQRTGLIVTAIFAIFSIYWGALYKLPTHSLEGWIVIGEFITAELNARSGPIIHWNIQQSGGALKDPDDVARAIVDEDCWIAIEGSLQEITKDYAVRMVSELIRSNISLAAIRPNVLVRPVYYTLVNVRPFDVPVASAVTFVGLIYLLILSFIVVNSGILARTVSGIEKKLTTASLIRVRLVSPVVIYLILSLAYTLVTLAFKLPFERHFGRAGFVIFWILSWFGMTAAGLALESMMTLLTLKYIQVFLILWIIGNVSVCLWPIETLPVVYRYGHAAPFYHISRGVRTIVFGTKDERLNFGVLAAWIGISPTAVVMLNMGGPSTVEETHDFLKNLFMDGDLIPLPFQRFLAPYIARRRTPKIEQQYADIGGGSPILHYTKLQGDGMAQLLDELHPETAPHKAYVAFRYARPLTEVTAQQMKEDGVNRAIAFTQYPQYSCSTTGSSLNELFRRGKTGDFDNIEWSVIDRWGTHPGFIEAVAQNIEAALAKFPAEKRSETVLLFSAHSLAHSQVGPSAWMGMQTGEALKGLARLGTKQVVLIPIAFTSDHIETLYELDLEYAKEAREHGIEVHRAASLNDSPVFIRALADIVTEHLRECAAGKGPTSIQLGLRCPGCTNATCGQQKAWFTRGGR